MPDQVKTAQMSLRIAAVLFFTSALFILYILIDASFFAGLDGPGRRLLGTRLLGPSGLLLLFVFVVAGLSYLRAAAGLSLREPRARKVGIGLGILMLPLLPFGLVLGGLVLSALARSGSRDWFMSPGGLSSGKEDGEMKEERPDDEPSGL